MTTRFSVSGMRNGKHVVIVWQDGKLSGNDPDTVWWIETLAQQLEGTVQGQIGGPYTTTDHLASPYTARALIRSVFPGTPKTKGRLPTIELPDGAVM